EEINNILQSYLNKRIKLINDMEITLNDTSRFFRNIEISSDKARYVYTLKKKILEAPSKQTIEELLDTAKIENQTLQDKITHLFFMKSDLGRALKKASHLCAHFIAEVTPKKDNDP
ncbi:MAG: hypothetical protein Q8R79_09010, partial [Legionellaceae bacterium]|nr:hypothetical protein [Legionellaceae bacterium]